MSRVNINRIKPKYYDCGLTLTDYCKEANINQYYEEKYSYVSRTNERIKVDSLWHSYICSFNMFFQVTFYGNIQHTKTTVCKN